MPKLTHLDSKGRAKMVDVGHKEITARVATAEATLTMLPATKRLISRGNIKKGDVFSVARIAGIQGAKRTHELIPLCHPLPLTSIDVDFEWVRGKAAKLLITATARCTGKTGVEMEALTAATVAGLTVYDMCKAADREMEISRVRLMQKSGGKSGDYSRKQGQGRK